MVWTPWASLLRLFAKYLVHIFEFGTQRRAGYYSAVPVIGFITALGLYWIRLSIGAMARVSKVYLELEGLLLILLIIWDRRSVGVLFASGWLSGTLAAGTRVSSGVSGVSVGVVGRELAIIYWNSLIARSCLYPIEKGDSRDGVFTAPARYSIARRAVLVEEEPRTGKLCGKSLIVFATCQERVSGSYTVQNL